MTDRNAIPTPAFSEHARELMAGATDMHLHASPDVLERRQLDRDVAVEARKLGMAGFVLKNHVANTALRAAAISDETGIRVHGAMALNYTVGGLSPYAVDTAMRLGTKVVWLPTIHAANHYNSEFGRAFVSKVAPLRHGDGPITAFTEDGTVRPEILEIAQLVGEAGAVLATGHLSFEETLAVVPAALDAGAERIVITHPFSHIVGADLDEVVRLTRLGAVYAEFAFVDRTPLTGHETPAEVVYDAIRQLDPAHVIISSDSGQVATPDHADMFGGFIDELITGRFQDAQIRQMVRDNPEALLS